MIDTTVLPVFLSAVLVLLLVPGPDFVLIATQSASRGAGHGFAVSIGVFLAGMLQTALVAAGLGGVMETWPGVATAIRIGGAVYIGWLGVRALRAWFRARHAAGLEVAKPVVAHARRQLVWLGLLNNLLNPKALVFFSVFLPQFVSAGAGDARLQLAALGMALCVLALGYNVLLSLLFGAPMLRKGMRNQWLKRHADGLIGALFCFLAARLALSKTAV